MEDLIAKCCSMRSQKQYTTLDLQKEDYPKLLNFSWDQLCEEMDGVDLRKDAASIYGEDKIEEMREQDINYMVSYQDEMIRMSGAYEKNDADYIEGIINFHLNYAKSNIVADVAEYLRKRLQDR